MLQAVLGVDAAAIAAAFAVEPATMAQRLVRAKKRIRDAGIPFAMPEREQLAERLPAVLEAVYGAYAIDWQVVPEGRRSNRCRPKRCTWRWCWPSCLPDEPEVLGLAALVCLSEARGPPGGPGRCFVPLDEQDTDRWDTALIARGEALLRRAHGHRPSPAGSSTRRPSSPRTAAGYAGAASTPRRCARCIGRWCGWRRRSAPRSPRRPRRRDRRACGGIARPRRIADPAVERFQPAWAVRAHLLARRDRPTRRPRRTGARSN